MNHTHTLASLCITGLVVGTAAASVIGIDNRNGYDAATTIGTGSDHSQFRAVIESMGHTLVLIEDFTDLDGIDALIAQNPHSASQQFSTDEILSINSFVGAGGGMLAIGEAGGASSAYIPNMNQMAMGFGAEFTIPELNGNGLIVSNFYAHAITAGISQIGVDYYRKILVSGDAMDLTGDASDFLAALDGTGGSGNTAFIGDLSIWKNNGAGSDYGISDFDNELLLRNIIGYTTVPAPSSLAMISAIGMLASRRRRD